MKISAKEKTLNSTSDKPEITNFKTLRHLIQNALRRFDLNDEAFFSDIENGPYPHCEYDPFCLNFRAASNNYLRKPSSLTIARYLVMSRSLR